MKKTNILYWIFTALFALVILSTALPNVMMTQEWVDVIHKQLGFPEYFIRVLGIAKILGVIGILVPGYPRVKEWSYAGLFFDLTAAVVCAIIVGGFDPMILVMSVFFAPGVLSYIFYHKKLKGEGRLQADFAGSQRM